MKRLLLFAIVVAVIAVLVKPDLIDMAKDKLDARERRQNIVKTQPLIPLDEGLKSLKKNYPSVSGWRFSDVTISLGSVIYVVTDNAVIDIGEYKVHHDVAALLQKYKQDYKHLVCDDEVLLNWLAHKQIRSVYYQFFDTKGIDFGRFMVLKEDCDLW